MVSKGSMLIGAAAGVVSTLSNDDEMQKIIEDGIKDGASVAKFAVEATVKIASGGVGAMIGL